MVRSAAALSLVPSPTKEFTAEHTEIAEMEPNCFRFVSPLRSLWLILFPTKTFTTEHTEIAEMEPNSGRAF
jgi:hypothetical protein